MKETNRIFLVVFALAISLIIAGIQSTGKIELNQATRHELESISGIGPALAGRIVLERNRRGGFRSMDDLLKIKGIGRKTLNRLRMCCYVDDSAHSSRQE